MTHVSNKQPFSSYQVMHAHIVLNQQLVVHSYVLYTLASTALSYSITWIHTRNILVTRSQNAVNCGSEITECARRPLKSKC